MSVINSENRADWQAIAMEAGKQRPYVGRKVRVDGGRKHVGRVGVVKRHQLDKFCDAFRYGGDANHAMREMRGRYGYVCLVSPSDGIDSADFWVKADYLTCDP